MKEFTLLGIGALLVAQLSVPASAQTINSVAIFGSPYVFETVAVDPDNNCYLSEIKTGTIYEVTREGAVSAFAQISGVPPVVANGHIALGLAFDCAGDLCVAVQSSNPTLVGIYKVSPEGVVSPFSVNQGFTAPNKLAFDAQGNLYVSDPSVFKVWKVDRLGNATLWSEDPLFVNVGSIPAPIGCNGLVVSPDQSYLYVGNTTAGTVIKVPIKRDGSAGAGSVLVQSAELAGLDGIALDINGNIYGAVNLQNQIVKVTPGGTVSILASATSPGGSLFSIPTCLAFGHGCDKTTMFICNSSEFPNPPWPSTPALSGLLELMNLDTPGIPADCNQQRHLYRPEH